MNLCNGLSTAQLQTEIGEDTVLEEGKRQNQPNEIGSRSKKLAIASSTGVAETHKRLCVRLVCCILKTHRPKWNARQTPDASNCGACSKTRQRRSGHPTQVSAVSAVSKPTTWNSRATLAFVHPFLWHPPFRTTLSCPLEGGGCTLSSKTKPWEVRAHTQPFKLEIVVLRVVRFHFSSFARMGMRPGLFDGSYWSLLTAS